MKCIHDLLHIHLPQHKADLHSDPNVAEEEKEEEEEGGTAEKHIAHIRLLNRWVKTSINSSRQVEAKWLTLHIPTLQYMKGLFLARMGVL